MRPTLLILAAGLGSRYGSLKQIDQIGPSGERIIDYSVFDAIQAGFGKIVYVIRESFNEEFNEVVVDRLPQNIKTEIVFQEIDSISTMNKYSVERIKPWGTGHALLSAASVINEPFAVINADDFYGADSFKIAAKYLSSNNSISEHTLIGYTLKNTLSEYGSVSRGICKADSNSYLESIVERTEIKILDNEIIFKDEKENWNSLTGEEIVSMNMFAYKPTVFEYTKNYFEKFIEENGSNLKTEFYMPFVVDSLIKNKEAKVKVLQTNANWFGLTYLEDKAIARDAINKLVEKEIYPKKLWLNG